MLTDLISLHGVTEFFLRFQQYLFDILFLHQRLKQIIHRAQLHGFAYVIIFIKAAQDNEALAGTGLAAFQKFNAIHAGHFDIQEDNIRVLLLKDGKSFVSV